jgi:hypothetical protein
VRGRHGCAGCLRVCLPRGPGRSDSDASTSQAPLWTDGVGACSTSVPAAIRRGVGACGAGLEPCAPARRRPALGFRSWLVAQSRRIRELTRFLAAGSRGQLRTGNTLAKLPIGRRPFTTATVGRRPTGRTGC